METAEDLSPRGLEDALAEAELSSELTPEFVSDPIRELKRGELPAELARSPSLGALLRDALLDWAWIGVILGVMYVSSARWWAPLLSPLLYPLCALLIAGRLHALGVVTHDVIHLPPPRGTKGRALYRALNLFAAYPIGTTLDAMRYHHLRHHRDSGMPTDPYFKSGVDERASLWALQWLRGALLFPFWSIRPYVGTLALLWPRLLPIYGAVFLQDRAPVRRGEHPDVLKCARVEWGQLVAQLPLWWALYHQIDAVIYGLIIPMWVTGLLASYRLLCEHRYTPTHDRSVSTIFATTCDHHLSRWDHLFLAPKNIGYHIMHHIHPQIGWRYLPEARAWYQARLGEHYPAPRSRQTVRSSEVS